MRNIKLKGATRSQSLTSDVYPVKGGGIFDLCNEKYLIYKNIINSFAINLLAFNSLAIDSLAIISVAIKISCFKPQVLSKHLLSNSFTINPVANTFICYPALTATDTFAIKPHLLSGQFAINCKQQFCYQIFDLLSILIIVSELIYSSELIETELISSELIANEGIAS